MAIDCTREQWQWIAKICNCRQLCYPINIIEVGMREHNNMYYTTPTQDFIYAQHALLKT